MRSTRAVLVLAFALASCGGGTSSSTGPTAVPTPVPVRLTAPRLVAPVAGFTVAQNAPDIGCTYDRVLGYGFEIRFEWAPAEDASGVTGYRLQMKHPAAVGSAVYQEIPVPTTTYVDHACHTYVGPPYLDGWEWHVQALAADGTAGPWSETRAVRFAPAW